MKKFLTFALAFSCLALGPSQSSIAQDASRTPVSVAESGNREQDRLNGPVRRVRVETVKVVLKDGNWVEGARQVLGVATYDPSGKKIDSIAYPLEGGTLPGKEHFIYDEKGNVVERIIRSDDGLMLSKEIYQYEFDQLGNWTKMSTSVAVFENGEISFEPTGVTYRTISYYYNQAIEELNAASTNSGEVPSDSLTRFPTPSKSSTDSPRSSTPSSALVSSTGQPLSEVVSAHAKKEPLTEAPPVLTAGTNSASSNPTTPDDAPATNVVQHVAEDVLRNSAVELPQPEYSDAAMLARASGKVKVQILVDKDGQVANAQATAGHPLLTAAAEAAARKARFSLPKTLSGATRAYGVISYDFVLPEPISEVVRPTNSTVDRNPSNSDHHKPEATSIRNASNSDDRKPDATPIRNASNSDHRKPDATPIRNASNSDHRKPDATPIRETASFVESKPKTPADYAEAARSFYNKGMTFQAEGRFGEAAQAFNQAIMMNPNDANAYSRLGMAYSALQKHKDAIVVYKMALQTNRRALSAPAYYMWGHSYLALEKNSDALSAFKQALYIKRTEAIDVEKKEPQQYPSLEQLHYSLGIAYLNSRRFNNAIDELKQAVALNPKNAAAYYSLAIAHLSTGNRREAEVHQKTLVSLDSVLAQKITAALAVAGPPPGCHTIACQ